MYIFFFKATTCIFLISIIDLSHSVILFCLVKSIKKLLIYEILKIFHVNIVPE